MLVIIMMATIRTTTGREKVVIESVVARVKNHSIPVKSVFHPEELRGYVFIEGEINDIEASIRGIPHVRGLISKDVPISQLERFLIAEKQEIKVEVGDIVEVVGEPFKGERGRVTHADEAKSEITIEFLEVAIPIPIKISVNAVRIHDKKKKK